MVFYDTLESPLGQILLAATERGLSAVAFTDEAPEHHANAITDRAKHQLQAYFDNGLRLSLIHI